MIQTFQAILNRLLNCNPHYLEYLEELKGISIAIEFTDFPLQFTFIAHHTYIEVQAGVQDVDLHLYGNLLSFISFATQKDERQALLQKGDIKFTGDLMILSKVENFLAHFNFKWLAIIPISKIKRFLENQIEYLQEEQGILASPVLFEHLQDELLMLQQEFDRLEARLQRLESLTENV